MKNVVTGGIQGGRKIDPYSDFEMTVERVLGDWIRADKDNAVAMWSALANVDWAKDGSAVGYSFRAGGDLIAALIGEGDYLDWYCSGPYATVCDHVAKAMATEGWKPLPATIPD